MSNRGASHRSGEDRISSLPDHLLCQILSNLPTKNAVTTSILSTRWRNIWLSTPILDIDINDVTTFVTFASRFLDFSKDSCLHKLKLSFGREDVDMCTIKLWIEDAFKRKIQHLEVDSRVDEMIDMQPLTFYLSETLVSLRLHFVLLHRFVFVSLPYLKVMHLEDNIYNDGNTLENLISSCPVLEDLTVVRSVDETTVKVLRVRSQSLNSLKLVLDSSKCWYNDDSNDWEVIIDAPRLGYLSLKDDQSVSFLISNLGSSAKVDINVSFNVSDIWEVEDWF
ncbi:F-box-like domain superfamily [Arabidopsis suecica]|uniref:F-box-like domain superfamily n=1 Tax=Arabidopsis suecica TaxID=45249 RepID=A0A8T1ZC49_ARASU|nr:F-box-like domain superfamily [Arabidopsis suecica]